MPRVTRLENSMTKVEVAGDDQGRKMKRKDYEKELRKLQVELCRYRNE